MARPRIDPRRQIDAFLQARKVLDGTASWQPGNRDDERRAVWPVLFEGARPGATLQATAYPHEPGSIKRFTIGLYWPDCIARLDYEPIYKKHKNPLPEVLRAGLDPLLKGPHYHGWAANRHLMKGARIPSLACAVAFEMRRPTWESAFRWFCGEVRIRVLKPQLLDFPRREKLL